MGNYSPADVLRARECGKDLADETDAAQRLLHEGAKSPGPCPPVEDDKACEIVGETLGIRANVFRWPERDVGALLGCAEGKQEKTEADHAQGDDNSHG